MKIRNREVPDTLQSGSGPRVALALGLAALGFLSYTACTAEKTAMKGPEAVHPVVAKTEIPKTLVLKNSPKFVDGVFAANEHLQTVYFELNKSKLSEKEMDVVKANVEWLKSQPPFLIRIIGYADSRGSVRKNERLADLRAHALRDVYVAAGLPKERIGVSGRVDIVSACEPLTEGCLAKNRRGDTLIEEKSLASR